MAVHVDWYNTDKTILYWRFIGKWTWERYFELMHEITPAVDASPVPVSVILDFTKNTTSSQHALSFFRKSEGLSSKNLDLIVIVGQNLIKMLVDMYRRLNANSEFKLVAVSSLEDALTTINDFRASHPPT